jgi:hypothetical protein
VRRREVAALLRAMRATAQFAVDRQIEHRKIARSSVQLQLAAD